MRWSEEMGDGGVIDCDGLRFLAGENFSCSCAELLALSWRDTGGSGGFDQSFEFFLVERGDVFVMDFVEWNVFV